MIELLRLNSQPIALLLMREGGFSNTCIFSLRYVRGRLLVVQNNRWYVSVIFGAI